MAFCLAAAGVEPADLDAVATPRRRHLLLPGGMQTPFFDGRPKEFKPAPDQQLNRPEDVARTVPFALRPPPGCELRELLVAPATEPSWP